MALVQPEPTIPDIFREISDKGDCPAMAQAIGQLHKLRRQDNFPTQDLAKVILQDPGLSTKILRVVNSAFFRSRGDPITTISRAVVLLGVDTVVELASGILLVGQFDDADPALYESLMESLRAAMLAQALAEEANLPSPEEAYLLGLFSNLGRLWLSAHYRDELARAVESQAAEADSIEDAIERHFGFTPDVLAAQILEQWGLPPKYSKFFRRHMGQGLLAAIESKLVLVAELSTETDDDELVRRIQHELSLSEERSRRILAVALDSLSDQAEALGIGDAPAKRSSRKAAAQPRAVSKVRSVSERASSGELAEPAAASQDAAGVERRTADSAFGMQAAAAIARAIVDREELGPLLRDVLEGVARAGGFDAAVLYLADATKENLAARLSTGEGVAGHLEELAVPLTPQSGVAALTFLDNTARVLGVASPALLVPAGTDAPDIPARSLVTHPLCVRERAIGVLVGMRGGSPAIGSPALAVMQLFSQLAALALDDRASAL